jgi:hypothetical protein
MGEDSEIEMVCWAIGDGAEGIIAYELISQL